MSNREIDQHQRFKDKARELGADESDDALDKSMDQLDLKQRPQQSQKREQDDTQRIP